MNELNQNNNESKKNLMNTLKKLVGENVSIKNLDGLKAEEMNKLERAIRGLQRRGNIIDEIDGARITHHTNDGRGGTSEAKELLKLWEEAEKARVRNSRLVIDWEGHVLTPEQLNEKLKQKREEQD